MNFTKIKKFLHYKKNSLPYYLKNTYALKPNSISIGVNSECNAKCIMCDIGLRNRGFDVDSSFTKILDKDKILQLEELDIIINKIKYFKPNIHINTTEPLLHPNIHDIISRLKRSQLSVSLTTNGLLLRNKALSLCNASLDNLIISIDGYSGLHDEIRGISGLFDIIVKGVDIIRTNSDIPIRVNFTINPYNYDKIYTSITEIRKKINPNFITLTHMNYVNDDIKSIHDKEYRDTFPVETTSVSMLDPTTIESDVLYKELNDVDHNYENINFFPKLNSNEIREYYKTPNILKNHNQCLTPWNHFQIAVDGEIYTMTRCFNYSFGNIITQDFNAIWNGKKIRSFRKNLLKCNGAMPACARCCAIF